MRPPVSLLALRAFAEIGRHGSVKRAAAALGVTPGAVSQQVKRLEQRLAVTLLERRNREIRGSSSPWTDRIPRWMGIISWRGREGEGLCSR
jgi:LysR family glycine cleavage system transcriptional activator